MIYIIVNEKENSFVKICLDCRDIRIFNYQPPWLWHFISCPCHILVFHIFQNMRPWKMNYIKYWWLDMAQNHRQKSGLKFHCSVWLLCKLRKNSAKERRKICFKFSTLPFVYEIYYNLQSMRKLLIKIFNCQLQHLVLFDLMLLMKTMLFQKASLITFMKPGTYEIKNDCLICFKSTFLPRDFL